MKVFISWSGERAKQMANALHGWLQFVLQETDPWCSDVDLDAGSFHGTELQERLRDSGYCVVCVTPENMRAPWVNYEAGAIGERLHGKTSPWMLDVRPEHLASLPLSRLQACASDEQGTLKLAHAINKCLGRPLTPESLLKQFNLSWPDLKTALASIPASSDAPALASDQERHSELLALLTRILATVESGRKRRRLEPTVFHNPDASESDDALLEQLALWSSLPAEQVMNLPKSKLLELFKLFIDMRSDT